MDARASLLKARTALLAGRAAEAVRIAQQAAEEAQARENFLMETRAYRVWLDAARRGGLDSASRAAESLAGRIQYLIKHTQNPEFRLLLTKMQESVDKKS